MAGFLCQISKKYSEEAPSIFAEIASKKVISIGARTRIDQGYAACVEARSICRNNVAI
jgi:hypothetical protein